MNNSSIFLVVLVCILTAGLMEANGGMYKIEEFSIKIADGIQANPGISGNNVIWVAERDNHLYFKNLANNNESAITTSVTHWTHTTGIDGNIIVWGDSRINTEPPGDIYGFDITTMSEFPICIDPISHQ